MARSSWDPHVPDILGVEFLGVGTVTHPIYDRTNFRALRFTAQRTGEVDEVAIYSGFNTVDPVLPAAHFFGHRAPYIVEMYPVSGFGYSTAHAITTYPSTITTNENVRDEVGTLPEGNELAQANDDLYLVQLGGLAGVQVQMTGASAFPLDRHVKAIAVEHSFLRQMRVRRLDANGLSIWNRVLPAGINNWHIGEAYIESGDTAGWRLWTPSEIRQFASPSLRRLRVESLSRTQSQIIDLLRLHVDSVAERRVGVGVFEPSANSTWFTVPFHAPSATGTPAQIVDGGEYVLVVRTPYGNTDYQALTRFEFGCLDDAHFGGGPFTHFTGLDWDLHAIDTHNDGTLRALGNLVDGMATIRLLNNGAQTVDTQPYERTLGARVYQGQDAVQSSIERASAIVEYGQVAFLVSAVADPVEDLTVTVETIGSFTVTRAQVDALVSDPSTDVGLDDFNERYRRMVVPFGAGFTIGAADFDVTFSSTTDEDHPWLISGVASRTTPGTGDQTYAGAFGSLATGEARDPVDGNIKTLADYGRVDLQVTLISQPSEITGMAISLLQQPVTGSSGACEPCGPNDPLGCTVMSIPYPRLCWDHATMNLVDFVSYEIQRQEDGGEWATVKIIGTEDATVTGGPVSGSGVPACWDDWSVSYDTPVCYQVRVRRSDDAVSDWPTAVCSLVESPAGADIIITAPDAPERNVAFPESYSGRSTVREWDLLDAGQVSLRQMYNRDNYVAFRPLERLGIRFSRRLLLSAMCTPTGPSLDVARRIRDLTAAPGAVGAAQPTLVVRDTDRNRWYASVTVEQITETVDPNLGSIWTCDIEVNEVTTPVIEAQ